MKKLFAFLLILGGFGTAAIVFIGNKAVNTKSDAEYLQEGLMAQQEAAEQAAQTRAELMKVVLSAPNSCEGLKAGIVFETIEGEPDPGADWPDWTAIATPAEKACLIEAFHITNAHAFKIQGKDYVRNEPSINRSSNFISDLGSATLFTDGIDYGENDGSLSLLINGYFADRATSRVTPGHDY